MALAEELGVPVEDRSKRTTTEIHFAQPDGLWRVDAFAGPQFVQEPSDDGDGAWREIDTTLEVARDGTISPVAYPVPLVLSAGGPGEETLLASHVADSAVSIELLWDESVIPEPTLDGPRAVYEGIRPGVDYVIDVLPSGFEQYYVVHSARAAEEFGDFDVDMRVEGAVVEESADGHGFDLVAGADVVGSAPTALAWDAEEDAKRSAPVLQVWSDEPNLSPGLRVGEGLLSDAAIDRIEHATSGRELPEAEVVPLSVEQDSDRVKVSLSVDEAWLADPLTEYPVVIDPSFIPGSTFDTYVRSNYGNSKFYNDSELLIGTWDGGSSKYRSYLNFNVKNLDDYEVVSARLNLWNHHSWTCSSRNWTITHGAAATKSTTWHNPPDLWSPSVTTGSTRGYSSSCADGWSNVDITTIARHWASPITGRDSYSLRLKANSETNNTYWKRFYSSDYSSAGRRPHISYDLNRYPNRPTNVRIAGSAGGSSPVRVSSSLTRPQVSATVTDPDGGRLHSMFGIEYATCANTSAKRLKTVQGSTVNSGGTSKWTFDFDMSRERFYRVVARADDGRVASDSNYTSGWVVRKNSLPAKPSNIRVGGLSGSGSELVAVDGERPVLTAKVTDPDGTGGLRAYFRVYREDGSQLASGWGSAANSGGTSSWTVTKDLQFGEEYYVRAKVRDNVDSASDCADYRDSSYTSAPTWRFERSNLAPSTPSDVEITGVISTVGGTKFTQPKPSFSARVADADGSTASIAVRVTKDGDPLDNGGQIVGNQVANGGVSSVALPYDMEPGASYEFEVFAWDGFKPSGAGVTFLTGRGDEEYIFTVADEPPREVPTTCDSRASVGVCEGN